MSNRLATAGAWLVLVLSLGLSWWLLAREDFELMAETWQTYERKQVLLQRLEGLPAREQQIKRKLADLGNAEAASYLFSGDQNEVQSRMQQDLRRIVTTVGLRITRMGAAKRNRKEDGLLQSSEVEVVLSARHEDLVKLIMGIEANQPLLNIQRLNVSVSQMSSETKPAMLSVSMNVMGFSQSSDGVQ